ncbi:MAG: hypothetical protein WDZ46_06755 [Solirubrobacterales bacterium]
MRGIAKAPAATASTTRLAFACALALCLLAFVAPRASAAIVHPFLFEFGPSGTPSSEFQSPEAIAVDQANGDVYVIDRRNGAEGLGVVARFTSAGVPKEFTAGPDAGKPRLTGFTFEFKRHQVAVAPPGALGGTAGDVYVASEDGVDVFASDGTHLGTIDGSGNLHGHAHFLARGVAVDPEGNLYIAYTGAEGFEAEARIEKYVPSGNPVSDEDFDSEMVGFPNGNDAPCQLAVTATTLYAKRCSGHWARRYETSLFPGAGGSTDVSEDGAEIAGGVFGLAVDPASEDLYLGLRKPGEGGGAPVVQRFDKEGNPLATIELPNGEADHAAGVGVNSTSARIYISYYDLLGGESRVRVYGPGEEIAEPTAAIDPPSSLTFKSAHFSGTVNSGGAKAEQQTSYRFQCAPACPGLQGDRPVPTDGEDHAVSDETTGLEAETEYDVTLIAESSVGKAEDTTSFTTPAKPVAEAPEVSIDPVAEFGATTAHLSGTIDPNGEGELQETAYRFEYTADGVKWIAGKEQGPIEGDGPQPVSEDLEELVPNTAYSVRLRAENVGGSATTAMPHPSFTTLVTPPLVETVSADRRFATSARLNGRISPRNAATTYRFEWGTADCASNPCASVPVGEDGEAGSADAFVSVHASLQGLSPETTYHFRLVAENAGGEAAGESLTFSTRPAPGPCPNASLRVRSSAALPHCRAYEMVSPVDKNGGNIEPHPLRTRAAADGGAVTYASAAGFAGTIGVADIGAEYLSRRDASGWITHPLTPIQETPRAPHAFTGSAYVGAFSDDLDKAVFRGFAPIEGATSANVAGVPNLYRAAGLRSGFPRFELASDAESPVPPVAWESAPHINLADTSADLGHIAFDSTDKLTGDAGDSLNAYMFADGVVRLVGILPDAACASPPCPAPQSVSGAGALTDGGAWGDGTYTQQANVVSDDGTRAFFTAADSLVPWRDVVGAGSRAALGFAGSIYMREAGERTVQIDASERSTPDPAGPRRSIFMAATPDGAAVFFLSRESLVDEDGGDGVSLYRYDVGAPAGERLTLMATPEFTPLYVVDTGDDGERVYVLDGEENLWVGHSGSWRLVAVRSSRGEPNLGQQGTFSQRGYREAQSTPGGRHVLFGSRANLTGYEPVPGEAGTGSTCLGNINRCSELYLYSHDRDELVCVSCDPSDAPPNGDARFGTPLGAGLTRNEAAILHSNTALSRDGRYVFFTSPDSLALGDTNGKLDVYVYDSERGEAMLLSSGECNCDSVFVDASPDGRDAFFTTREQLVRQDADQLIDIYDARVNGGIPAQNALPSAECQGDACQPPGSAPDPVTPASSGFVGVGNSSAAGQRRKNCRPASRHARRLGLHAKRLRAMGRKAASEPRRAGQLRRRANKLRRKGKRMSGMARACRQRNRRVGR